MENEEVTNAAAEEQAPVTEAAPETNEGNNQGRPNRFDHRNGGNSGHNRFGGHGRPQIVKEYEEKVVHIGRICKVVKGGKRIRFSALVVIGNHKGKFGFGIGKSIEVPAAIKKAIAAANVDIRLLPIVKNDTIPHEIWGEFGACKVFLKPAPAGTGIVAGGPVRAILELAGVKNVYSKVYGSRSSINVIRATADGISKLHFQSAAQAELNREAGKVESKPEEVK